ncbi:tRNA(His) guanylyltransferase [Tolypocladium capitatum]|uniref:tRNA(His) guanylyltransferase n=1 Tax=Tolypocladium capitatum TaxID=45235 RepID=A0A2K3QAQ6_9HYPO|nr:tRNA(His) guanylyltransferase [Tolypocladium capitatum]
MANSKFEYVRGFEQTDALLPNTWIVVRVDGRAFTKMCANYGFEKPNDRRALDLMNVAAKAVVADLPEIAIGYGISDEYSFVFHKSCNLFERRSSKLVSTIVSTFTANYVYSWSTYFPDTPLSCPLPTFDGRAVCYPTVQNLRDYLSWRQVDCTSATRHRLFPSCWLTCQGHINNLYNTTFWALVQLGGLGNKEAEKTLAGTLSADKNEMLFSRFRINYNNEPEMFKKGSVIFRDYELVDPDSHRVAEEMDDLAEPVLQSKSQADKDKKRRSKARVVVEHLDIIKDEFWDKRPWILSGKPGKVPKET